MESKSEYHMEERVIHEVMSTLQAGAEVAGLIVKAFRPLSNVGEQIILRETSHILRSLVFRR